MALPRPRSLVMLAAAGLLAGAASLHMGCAAGQLVGGMMSSYHRTGATDVQARYRGLAGKNFAVVVHADRVIQADFPEVVGDLTVTIARRLADPANNVGAAGYVPGERVLQYQYNNPRWVVMPWLELAKEMGVDRLIVVELHEFRLSDPGNQYTWAGVAAGTVRVIEADGPSGDVPVLQEPVTVRFPDKDGYGPMQIPASGVRLALCKRFVDRASWLFYDHEEPNAIEY